MANLLDEVTGYDNDIDRYIHVIDSQHFRVPTEESCTRENLQLLVYTLNHIYQEGRTLKPYIL